jgi:cysteinyl-tRNA synthetase
MVLVNGKKSSRVPAEDPLTLQQLLEEGYTGREVRYWLFSRHYRKPIFFSRAKLDAVKNTIANLDKFAQKLHLCKSGPDNPDMDQLVYDLRHKFTESMDDDFNIAPALAALFQFTRRVNKAMDINGLSNSDKEKVLESLARINSVLGVMDLGPPEMDGDLKRLIEKREQARRSKDWNTADRLRKELEDMGVEVIDTKEGPVLRKIRE